MRIIGGKFKGKKIFYIKSNITRPLKDSVKENIFNILNHSNEINIKIENSYVLDLYSGIGSFGLECISRGSKEVTFVEKSKEALKILHQNLQNLSALSNAEIVNDKIENIIYDRQKKYEILFLDPPFRDREFFHVLKELKEKKINKKRHVVIIHREKNSEEELNKIIQLIKVKEYGRSKIIFGTFI